MSVSESNNLLYVTAQVGEGNGVTIFRQVASTSAQDIQVLRAPTRTVVTPKHSFQVADSTRLPAGVVDSVRNSKNRTGAVPILRPDPIFGIPLGQPIPRN